MSRFHVGDLVWIDWHPDEMCGARRARCTTGVIVGGPFPPGDYGPYRHEQQNWFVDSDEGGPTIRADEDVLQPFHDPDREVEIEKCLELTE